MSETASETKIPAYLRPSRTLIMGVLNVTPNSFSDGGKWFDTEAAIKHGQELLSEGADLIDVGGESTAPGNDAVEVEEEINRVVPVIKELSEQGALISCDTMHASTAEAAVEAGAKIINDVSGGMVDPEMFDTVAKLMNQNSEVSYLCQHWRGHLKDANRLAVYENPHLEVFQELRKRLDTMSERGDIDMHRVIIDPGLGFSKQGDQDWDVLANLDTYLGRGFPVLIGPSRKRFLADFETNTSERHARDDATASLSLFCAMKKVWAVRVHNVAPVAVGFRALEKLKQFHEPRYLLSGLD